MTKQLQKIIVPAKLFCPSCGARHIDETRNGEKWDRRAHTTHRCQSCGEDWDVYVSGAPDEPTVGAKVEGSTGAQAVMDALRK